MPYAVCPAAHTWHASLHAGQKRWLPLELTALNAAGLRDGARLALVQAVNHERLQPQLGSAWRAGDGPALRGRKGLLGQTHGAP